jgi:CxxC motif-containing protein (DUF1111 family)
LSAEGDERQQRGQQSHGGDYNPRKDRDASIGEPLWGARTHGRHMHDGASVTFDTAIQRHRGEAQFVTNNYNSLSTAQQNQVVAFMKSL